MNKPKTKRPFKIQEKHRAAVKMLVDEGCKVQEAAAILGVHRTTLWRWFQHRELQRFCERYAKREIKRLARKEAERIGKMIDSDDPYEAYYAAVKVLNTMDDWLMA